jgi:hypothetical protein
MIGSELVMAFGWGWTGAVTKLGGYSVRLSLWPPAATDRFQSTSHPASPGKVDLHHLEPGLVHSLGCSFLAKESVAICDSCTLNGDPFSAQSTS